MANCFLSVKEIKGTRGLLKNDKGIYKWWCNYEGIIELINALGVLNHQAEIFKYLELHEDKYCFYVGQTQNKFGFKKRIKGQHLRPHQKNSTLRRSLFAVFNSREKVDNFLANCFVSLEKLDEDKIDKQESFEINYKLRLLNIKDLENNGQEFISIRNKIVNILKQKR